MAATAAADRAETLVPHNHLMAALLGQRDELLRLVEGAFPRTQITVRGNLISVDGEEAERVARLFDELVLVLESGQGLDAAKVARTIDMVREDLRPSEVLNVEVMRAGHGPHDPAPHRRSEALHRRHRGQHDHLRHRPRGHRQVLPRRGARRAGAPVAPGEPDHLDPSGRGGRRAARVPPR